MGWSAGTFSRARDWTADEAGAIDMEAVNFDQEDDNFATGINTCLTKDGQNEPTGNLPMGTNKHTDVGNATAKDDYASAADVIDQHLTYYADTGAADAYVITPSPSIAGYAEGQRLVFRATNANTGATTLNVNGLGAKAVETNDGNALTAGMIASGGYYEVTYDAQATTRFVLSSPHSFQPVITAGAGMTGGGTLPASVTLNCIGGTGITVNANDIETDDSAIVHANLSGYDANDHIDHTTVSVVAGTGLTGGGTIAANRTINVIGGNGITANTNDIALSATVAGAGMTHSSGVLNVIAGDGIVVNANDIDVDINDSGSSATELFSAEKVLALTDPIGVTKYKTANTAKNTDIVLADDPHLAGWSLENASYYSVDGWLRCSQGGASAGGHNMTFAFTNAPSSTGGFSIFVADNPGVGDVAHGTGITSELATNPATTNYGVFIRGMFVSNATGGTVDFQWCQDSSDALASNVLAGSYIKITKMS